MDNSDIESNIRSNVFGIKAKEYFTLGNISTARRELAMRRIRNNIVRVLDVDLLNQILTDETGTYTNDEKRMIRKSLVSPELAMQKFYPPPSKSGKVERARRFRESLRATTEFSRDYINYVALLEWALGNEEVFSLEEREEALKSLSFSLTFYPDEIDLEKFQKSFSEKLKYAQKFSENSTIDLLVLLGTLPVSLLEQLDIVELAKENIVPIISNHMDRLRKDGTPVSNNKIIEFLGKLLNPGNRFYPVDLRPDVLFGVKGQTELLKIIDAEFRRLFEEESFENFAVIAHNFKTKYFHLIGRFAMEYVSDMTMAGKDHDFLSMYHLFGSHPPELDPVPYSYWY